MNELLKSTRFVLLMYVNTWVFLLMLFGKIPDIAYTNDFWLFMTALNGGIALSKVAEKYKSGTK